MEPLALEGFNDHYTVTNRAQQIAPSLTVKSGGESSKFIVCIGWDRNAVWKLADEANKERYEREAKEQERAAKEREEEWEEVMEVHRELVASIKKKKGKKGPTTQRKRLNKCRGSYAIQCED